MTDFAARRRMMVDNQVRPSDVTKYPIIDALLEVEREHYVPQALKEAAYLGENLEIGGGRVMLDPRTLAKMLDVLDLENDEMVLDLGCGLGYSSAVIAQIAQAVIAVEQIESLADEAEALLAAGGADNVVLEKGPLAEGAPQHGPYDAIILQGAVEQIPEALEEQLKEGGRIVALFIDDKLGTVRIGYKIAGRVNWRYAFNASAPVLSGFESKDEFTL
ncbi:protein-L-isoaspartate O-methyltransferase [Rhodobacteraceae bacterium 63075]|nr:protein-L-isoaspartate O-methyltransferase [Rhodobacteraceae bacterium 63075]